MTIEELKAMLRDAGSLRLGEDAVRKLADGALCQSQPDLQWLYDCAMENGNSEGRLNPDPLALHFDQAGTCMHGIVCKVTFDGASIPACVLDKGARGECIYPEDMGNVCPTWVDICYDESEDEIGDDPEENEEE